MTQLDELQQSSRELLTRVEELCDSLGEGKDGLAGQIKTMAEDIVAIKKIRGRAVMFFVLAVLFSVAAFTVSGLIAHHEIGAVKESKYQSCLARNAESVQNAQQISSEVGPLYIEESTRPHPDPVLLSILGALAHYKASTVPCTK